MSECVDGPVTAALRALAGGPLPAGQVGAALWPPDKRRGRVSASQGGGDFAAQMLLGRLRKQGLVRVARGLTNLGSRWELTDAGREILRKLTDEESST